MRRALETSELFYSSRVALIGGFDAMSRHMLIVYIGQGVLIIVL
jgi:hypothetical protein